MGKSSGGNRKIKPYRAEYIKRMQEVREMQASGEYSSVTMSKFGGGYVAIERSPKKHSIDEIEAATILANNGYKVILKNEAGQAVTPDGYIFSISFEQRTPTSTSVKKALEHAKAKTAEIALIYDKHHIYHKADVIRGVKEYEAKSTYRFKQIIVVAQDGRIHRHKHNK